MSQILKYCKTHLSDNDYIFVSTIFKNCSEATQAKMEIVTYEKGHPIMETGDPNTYVYVLLKGKVSVVDEQVPSYPFTFGEYRAIDVLGDYELFSNASGRFVSLRAKNHCVCIRINSGDYMNWVREDVNALFIRMNMLMSVLSRETQFLRQFLFLDIETRIIVFLYEEYQKYGDVKQVKINAKREDIASKMACSVRTLNRSLQKIESNGLLTRQNGKIYISQTQHKLMGQYIIENEVILHPF
ncbi:CRP-like cAMP-binding protein [Breznakia sp. PF5-3]|uniref:Crp/Fnr family transcriptional regulator n=1 Tax=unclassified Breznakia TaxID=2623764 RepID=UPI002405B2CD|nr:MULTISPECIES: Crp/Fnr family transcriptional regulator [unclassified Breznakia]MDF9825667.1 CRP-like cAMP-binding protein [Breznakia sp. PM6-1]MDF9836493.1 CRP-like cAMP-binding protein [Breznakia sp. PF5-3]MDF9838638.1 CRP-like cAMP-binding protein [Breznakia sp. PFB2-8]MDF9860669.1 CRP-like cAMP-binding protein [Breznakia sp. PH5-24]